MKTMDQASPQQPQQTHAMSAYPTTRSAPTHADTATSSVSAPAFTKEERSA